MPRHLLRNAVLAALALAPLSLAQAPATQPATQPVALEAPATRPATQPATQPVNPLAQARNNGLTVQPGGGILLNFKDASIDSVLDELSSAAGFVVVKEVKPEGRVTLTSKQPVNKQEAISLLNTVLKNAGYAAIQQERILKIVARDKARKLNIPVRTGSDPKDIPNTDELVTQVMPLRFTDAVQLRNDLSPLLNPESDFTANASSNALVITDTSANIRRIAEIISALDTSVADAAEVKVFQLKYASASNTARLITDVFGQQAQTGQRQQGGFNPFGGGGGPFGGGGAFGGGAFGGGGDQGGGRRGGGGTAQSTRSGTRLTAAADDRTNTLVVSGSTEVLKAVAIVVKELDANPASDEAVFIYRLKNATAANVEAVVNNLFNGTNYSRGSSANLTRQTGATSQNRNTRTGNSRTTGSTGGRTSGSSNPFGSTGGTFGAGNTGTSRFGGTGTTGRGFGGLSTGAMNTAASLAGEVTIIADPDTNSLLVRTNPANYERVKEILKELDRPVAQVLIKVLIAEVTHDNNRDLGVEFSALNIRPSGLGQKVGTNYGLANLTSGMVAQILETDFSATVRALETAGKLDVLSRPYILASDNQQASITVGQEVPFITNSRTTDTGQTINTIEYGDIGILLDVIPHINPDGLVILDVAPEISALTGTTVPVSENVSAPVFAKRSAYSRVGIRSGQTVVIGGLMADQQTETINKVPLLGDLPLLGALFRRTENKKSKTELLIFLTPHVAADPSNLSGMSKEEIEGSKLVPGAVYPGAFKEHSEGLNRGEAPPAPPEKE